MTTQEHAKLLNALEFGTIPEKIEACDALVKHAQKQYDTLSTIPHAKSAYAREALKALQQVIDLWESEARILRTLTTLH